MKAKSIKFVAIVSAIVLIGSMYHVVGCATNESNYVIFVRPKDDNGNDLYLEDTRDSYEEQIKTRYGKLRLSEKAEISKDIDELMIEYQMLRDLITKTDQYVFVKDKVDPFEWADKHTEDTISYYKDDDLSNKIQSFNSLLDCYNTAVVVNSSKSYEFGKIADLLNLWWYSLGNDRGIYEYILENIDDKTWDINQKIRSYNKHHKEEYHLSMITHLEPLYPYNEVYTLGYMQNWNDVQIKIMKDKGIEVQYPQTIK